jgi:hypothetical protein
MYMERCIFDFFRGALDTPSSYSATTASSSHMTAARHPAA